MGTIDYTPPEQSMDCRKADQRAVIYSPGCELLYLLTGRAISPCLTHIQATRTWHNVAFMAQERQKNSRQIAASPFVSTSARDRI